MRFIDLNSGAAFNPTSDNWPENAGVVERFVTLRIHRHDDHVVAEDPAIYWQLEDFLKAAGWGKELKDLLGKAKNVIRSVDAYDGPLKYATWTSPDGKSAFQFAYSELDVTHP